MDVIATAKHVPVMLDAIVKYFEPPLSKTDSVFVDCTLGLGGHTKALLSAYPNCRAIVFDRDPQAMAIAKQRLADFEHRIHFCEAVFDEYQEYVTVKPNAVLADLGMSSLQIDETDRGFSYAKDAPLDMRMSVSGMTAADVLNTYDEAELARIIYQYGDELAARKIAKLIVANRPFQTSKKLVDLLSQLRTTRSGHPAKRVFQALRIEVNDELGVLDRLLPAAIESLALGGRFAVLSYHSLEDRRVKRLFREVSSVQAPRDLPVIPVDLKPKFSLLTRGAERPTVAEIETNPRSASARLRVLERSAA